jgi:hypothetical protein
MAWEVFKDDFESMKSAVGNTSEARSQFSVYLVGRGQFEQGLRLWGSIPDTEQREHRETADELVKSLIGAHHFHDALKVWNDITPDSNQRAVIDQVLDGGFESGAGHGPSSVFSWHVQSLPQVQIGIDPNVGHNSSRSLRMVFQVRSKLDSLNVSQLVPARADTQYDLECYFKTNRLESAGTLFVSITDASDGKVLANSVTIGPGSTDWQRLPVEFRTGPNTEAVQLKINRASCGDDPVCPIFGTIWYDDFNLKPRS